MNEKFKRNISLSLPFILMAIFLYLAFRNIDLNESVSLLYGTKPLWLLLFIFVFMLSHYIRAYRWKYILASVKDDVSVKHLFGAVMVGYGLNAVIPRAGEIFRAFFLGRWEKISRTSIFGTVILERIIDIFALSFSVMISILIYNGDLLNDVSWLKLSLNIVFIGNTLVILLIFAMVIFKEKFTNLLIKLTKKISVRLAEKINYLFETLTTGLSSLKGGKNYFMTFLLTVIIMLVYAFNSWVAFKMIGMDSFKEITFSMAWILMTISAFGIIIPTPGGTGSYHLITISVLSGIFAFGDEISSAYAILTHFISYIIFIFSAIFFISIINRARVKEGKPKLNFLNVIKKMDEEDI